MAQLRHDYPKLQALRTEVLVVVPNGPKTIANYVRSHEIPYLILSDKGSKVAAQYFQIKKFFSLGTPTVFVVDQTGYIRYTHYSSSLIEEPNNQEPINLLATMQRQ